MSRTITSGQQLKVTDAPRGEYAIAYELLTADQGDTLTLTVDRGRVSAFINQQWQPISGSLALQDGQTEGNDTLRLRVDRRGGFTFGIQNSPAPFPGNSAPVSPGAVLSLPAGLDSDMGDKRSQSWKVGKVDKLTGFAWDNGITGAIGPGEGVVIRETIGGDDVSDYASFRLTKGATMTIQTDGAIAQLINSKGMVVADSSDAYNSQITSSLTRGTYYLGFSSESSMSEVFTSRMTIA